ncbi:MAG: hypothetical protein U0X20_17090 [Caldilineaceae bacterium]
MSNLTDAPADTLAGAAGNTANNPPQPETHTFRIWYMTPALKTYLHRNQAGLHTDSNANGLTKTLIPYTHRCVDVLHNVTDWPRGQTNAVLQAIYDWFQGENWSPNGEAKPLIEALQLEHTSMSTGDVIEHVNSNRLWMVANFGFTEITQ